MVIIWSRAGDMLCFQDGDGVMERIQGAAAETAGCLLYKTLGCRECI